MMEDSPSKEPEISLNEALEIFQRAQVELLDAHDLKNEECDAGFARAATLASRLVGEGARQVPRDLRSRGWFILGNALGGRLLSSDVYELVPGGMVFETRRRLTSSAGAFEQALNLATDDHPLMVLRVRIQLAKALSGLACYCGDVEYLPLAIAAWRDVISHAEGEDLTRARLNLANILIANITLDSPERFEEAHELVLALEEIGQEPTDLLRPAILQLRSRFETYMVAPDGLFSILDYLRSVRLARDANARRRFLEQAIKAMPDYTMERHRKMSAPIDLVAAELEALRRSGLPSRDPARWKSLKLEADAIRQAHEGFLANDRCRNSALGGKALLTARLADSAQFVLLLRSFELETLIDLHPFPRPEEFNEILQPLDAYSRRLITVPDNIFNLTVEALAPDVTTLLVMNAEDPFPPPSSAKLFASGTDWRRLVFALAAEAAAVVLAIPYDRDDLSAGISDELRALFDIGATAKTIVLLTPALRSLAEPKQLLDHLALERLQGSLRAKGFDAQFTLSEVEANARPMSDLVRRLVARP